MRHSYYYTHRLNKNKTNSLWTNRPKSGIILGTSYLHPSPYLIGGTMPSQIIIKEGDKLTIITQDSVAVCLVESIRPRQPGTYCGDEPVDPCPCGCGVAIQELQVMKRNGKN